jgi:hypothetical protein
VSVGEFTLKPSLFPDALVKGLPAVGSSKTVGAGCHIALACTGQCDCKFMGIVEG